MINERRVKKYCKEDISKIKNYDKAIADTTQIWICHHMTETWWNCTPKDLIENECYYNRKACELIFLTKAEHNRIHNQGKHISEETRRKLSVSLKGRHAWNKDKHHSDKTRRKISESMKGKPSPRKGVTLSDETRRKLSEVHKGRRTKGSSGMHWYNNGVENILTYTCPDGYIKGRLNNVHSIP